MGRGTRSLGMIEAVANASWSQRARSADLLTMGTSRGGAQRGAPNQGPLRLEVVV